MVEIDFDKFNTEAEFRLWLLTDEGRIIFDFIYNTVIEYFGSTEIRHIPVIVKKHEGTVYSVDLNNLSGFCYKAIRHYEITEEYEKCAQLIKILNQIPK